MQKIDRYLLPKVQGLFNMVLMAHYLTNHKLQITQVQMSNWHRTNYELTIYQTRLASQMTICKYLFTMSGCQIAELRMSIALFTFIE